MDAELKKKWVEALRSGKYVQGNGTLCHGGKYCCLGVLVDILPAKLKNKYRVRESHGFMVNTYDRDCDMVQTIHPALRNEIGLKSEVHNHLYLMNDIGRKSFSEIADYIEKHDV